MEKNGLKWTTVVIDDEKPARDSLKTILTLNFPEFEVIGEADSVETGVELLGRINPDLIFLDIHLSDGSGFNLLERLEVVEAHVVFLTAYDSFAISAFKVNALDYIMKPAGINSLKLLVDKMRKYEYRMKGSTERSYRNGMTACGGKLIVRELDGVRYLKVREILRCQSHNNYTEFHMVSGERLMTSRTLKEYSGILEKYGFFRIYQSHLVNLSMIKKIITRDGLFVEMENGDVLELSRGKRTPLLELMAAAY